MLGEKNSLVNSHSVINGFGADMLLLSTDFDSSNIESHACSCARKSSGSGKATNMYRAVLWHDTFAYSGKEKFSDTRTPLR